VFMSFVKIYFIILFCLIQKNLLNNLVCFENLLHPKKNRLHLGRFNLRLVGQCFLLFVWLVFDWFNLIYYFMKIKEFIKIIYFLQNIFKSFDYFLIIIVIWIFLLNFLTLFNSLFLYMQRLDQHSIYHF